MMHVHISIHLSKASYCVTLVRKWFGARPLIGSLAAEVGRGNRDEQRSMSSGYSSAYVVETPRRDAAAVLMER